MITRSILLRKYRNWDRITRCNEFVNNSVKSILLLNLYSLLEVLSNAFIICINILKFIVSLPITCLLLIFLPLIYIKEKLYKIYGLKLFGIKKNASTNKFKQWRIIRNKLYNKSNLA